MKIYRLLACFAVVLALFFAAWLQKTVLGPPGLPYLRHGATLLATWGVVFIFMQFFLSARLKTLERGIGLDRLLFYHRISGRVGLGLLYLHFVLIFLYQWLAWGRIVLSPATLVGLAALAGFSITAALASTYKKLGLSYETWKGIHLLNYAFFPVALYHVFSFTARGSLLYDLWLVVAAAYAAIIVYRLSQIWRLRSNPFTVAEVRREAEDIWSLFFKGNIPPYQPGQFLMVQLLRGGKRSSSHPFTISSSPTNDALSITAKELGDFTADIKETRVGDKAFIDAPYGVFSFLNYAGDELVFIAGGIGITPFMSMLRYMAERQLQKRVTLFWANKSEQNLCLRDELAVLREKLPSFTPVLIMSGQKDWPGEQGRLNANLIRKYVPDLAGKHFYVCGPPAMSVAVRGELRKLQIPARQIHFEVFEL